MAPSLSICFSTFGQPVMLKHWFDMYLNEPEEYRRQCEVICVDDCGDPPAEVPSDPTIKLYRVKDNIPWNQCGARNLAAHVATAPILLLIDVDMTIPPGMLKRFVGEAKQHRAGLVLHPYLVHSFSGKKDSTSPNVHLLRKRDFLACGGYQEDYAGHKGWSDVTMLRVMTALLKSRKSEQLYLVLHHDSNIPDAQVRTLDRDVKHNRKLHDKHIAICHRSGYSAFARANRRIRFQWEQIR